MVVVMKPGEKFHGTSLSVYHHVSQLTHRQTGTQWQRPRWDDEMLVKFTYFSDSEFLHYLQQLCHILLLQLIDASSLGTRQCHARANMAHSNLL